MTNFPPEIQGLFCSLVASFSPTVSEMPPNILDIESERVREVYLKLGILLYLHYTSIKQIFFKKCKNVMIPSSVMSYLYTAKVMDRDNLC